MKSKIFMMKFLRQWWPELLLIVTACFFTFRELTTFPAPWEDSSLYTIVARSIANGNGYALPLLGKDWLYPYFLSVGPAAIVPAAMSIKLFGTGRVAMAIYLLLCSTTFYYYVRTIAGKNNARWATGLLVTLSAFVNLGKPVSGSVAALFYLFATLLLLHKSDSRRNAILVGLLLGLSLLSKITYFVVIPAFLLAVIADHHAKNIQRTGWRLMSVIIAMGIFLPWLFLEMSSHGGFTHFMIEVFIRNNGRDFLGAVLSKGALLMRFQYVYFLALFVLSCIGFFTIETELSRREKIVLICTIALFLIHFLIREGWYRLLLPVHVLLLPFVPSGTKKIFPKFWVPLLLFFISAQFFWQLGHRGSSTSTGAFEAVAYITKNLTETNLLIRNSEIFARLPSNPHWFYYPKLGTYELIPSELLELNSTQKCFSFIQKGRPQNPDEFQGAAKQISTGYYLIPPLKNCQ
jgi:hypothetical protein